MPVRLRRLGAIHAVTLSSRDPVALQQMPGGNSRIGKAAGAPAPRQVRPLDPNIG
jgi:hypothetical protein